MGGVYVGGGCVGGACVGGACTHIYVEAEVLHCNLNTSCDWVCSGMESSIFHRELESKELLRMYVHTYMCVCMYVRIHTLHSHALLTHFPNTIEQDIDCALEKELECCICMYVKLNTEQNAITALYNIQCVCTLLKARCSVGYIH